MKVFTGLVMILALAGCGMGLKKFDAETVRQVEKTIAFEGADFEITLEAFADGAFSPEERASMTSRHESEMTRLRAWLDVENAKNLEAKKP